MVAHAVGAHILYEVLYSGLILQAQTDGARKPGSPKDKRSKL